MTEQEIIQMIERASNDLFRRGNSNDSRYIHDSQIDCAKKIVIRFNTLDTRRNHLNLVAKMQSGKTGAMNAVVNIINQLHLDSYMGVNKFLFVTGMNDCGLKSQTFERIVTQIIGANVENTYNGKRSLKYKTDKKYFLLKNSDFDKFDTPIDNSVIFIDECHYGSGKNNKLTKFLERNGINWRNTNDLIKRNIYIVSISATPYSELVSDVAECKEIIELETNRGYVGVSEFIDKGLVRDAKSAHIEEVGDILYALREGLTQMRKDGVDGICFVRSRKFDEIQQRDFIKYNFDVYEMDASTTKINYDKLENCLREHIEKIEYNKKFEGVTLPSLLSQKIPTRPLIVIIKGAFRAGVTIKANIKDYVYLVYDYSSNAAATAQALLGRMCGYRNENSQIKTQFFINGFLANQYGTWEQDFTNRDNIPCDKVEKDWIDCENSLTDDSVITSVSCGNFAIDLNENEIEMFYDRCKGKKTCAANAKILFDKLLKDRGIDCDYNYFCEAHTQGKNNYAASSQAKRFDSFSASSLVFGFRADKIKAFQNEKGRDYLISEDFGLSCVSIVLDADIAKSNGKCIGGNMRLLVYHSKVGAYNKVPNQKSMYQQHKDTSLI